MNQHGAPPTAGRLARSGGVKFKRSKRGQIEAIVDTGDAVRTSAAKYTTTLSRSRTPLIEGNHAVKSTSSLIEPPEGSSIRPGGAASRRNARPSAFSLLSSIAAAFAFAWRPGRNARPTITGAGDTFVNVNRITAEVDVFSTCNDRTVADDASACDAIDNRTEPKSDQQRRFDTMSE